VLVTVLLYGALGSFLLVAFFALALLIGVLLGCVLGLPGLDVEVERTCTERDLPESWRDQLDELRHLPVVRR
jgi:uncharacterized protein (DUF58 family)